MRVNQSTSNQVQGSESAPAAKSEKSEKAAGAKKTGKAHLTERPEKGDKAEASGDTKTEISGRAKEMATAKQAAADAPDTREEKIAALKARISAGKYHVDSDAVADKLVDEHISMSGIG